MPQARHASEKPITSPFCAILRHYLRLADMCPALFFQGAPRCKVFNGPAHCNTADMVQFG